LELSISAVQHLREAALQYTVQERQHCSTASQRGSIAGHDLRDAALQYSSKQRQDNSTSHTLRSTKASHQRQAFACAATIVIYHDHTQGLAQGLDTIVSKGRQYCSTAYSAVQSGAASRNLFDKWGQDNSTIGDRVSGSTRCRTAVQLLVGQVNPQHHTGKFRVLSFGISVFGKRSDRVIGNQARSHLLPSEHCTHTAI
jgi:hypothetical protein